VGSFFQFSEESKNLNQESLYDHNYIAGQELVQIRDELPHKVAKAARTRKLGKINSYTRFGHSFVSFIFSVL
jgi:hypothetical protein